MTTQARVVRSVLEDMHVRPDNYHQERQKFRNCIYETQQIIKVNILLEEAWHHMILVRIVLNTCLLFMLVIVLPEVNIVA